MNQQGVFCGSGILVDHSMLISFFTSFLLFFVPRVVEQLFSKMANMRKNDAHQHFEEPHTVMVNKTIKCNSIQKR